MQESRDHSLALELANTQDVRFERSHKLDNREWNPEIPEKWMEIFLHMCIESLLDMYNSSIPTFRSII